MKLLRFCFVFTLMLICCTGALHAQTVYVNSSTGNDATGTGSSGSPYKTFSKGYNMVSVGGTIDVTGTFTWTDVDETGDGATSGYTIAKNITIQGHVGQTIVQAASSAGSANCRVFTIDGAYSVTFNNLEIRYGNPPYPGDGGAMYFGNSATITISNCYIHHNTSRQGAGICIMTATVGITNSTIANNNGTMIQSGLNGGGICLQGVMPLTITNTTICNNYINGYGGGINTLATNATTLTNCTIVNNTSNDDGGGISIGGAAGCVLQIKNTIIANNISNTVPASADVDMFSGTLTDNGYNIVEVGTGTFTATGDKTGNQANLFGTGVGTTPALALNNSIYGTPTLKTTAGSVAINAGNSSANGSVSVPSTDQRGGQRNGTTDIGAYEYWNDAGMLPVELSSFTATVANNTATLAWTTATETNNYGFEIERRNLSLPSPNRGGLGWGSIGFVAGNGTSNTKHTYSFADANVSPGTYAYRLKQIDVDGTYKYSNETEVTIAVPTVFALNQNYPNPFNPSTTIVFDIPERSQVTLKIYDLLGKEVATLVNNEVVAAGNHTKQWNAANLPSGVYFYRLQAGSFTQTKRLVLLK